MWVPWDIKRGRCRQEERGTPDIWTPPLHWVPWGAVVECLTGGHKDTWHMDWTPPLGPLGDSGESLIDEHLWHYRDPGRPETYTTCEEWVPWESIRTLSYFVIHCLAMSYHMDRHTPVNGMKRGPQGRMQKNPPVYKTIERTKTQLNVLSENSYKVLSKF